MINKSLIGAAIGGAIAVITATNLAVAQEQAAVQVPQAALPGSTASLAFPSVFGTPTAVAPRPGTAFVGATYANPRGGVSGAGGDGDIVAGYAIGNPLDGVSVTFGVALTGVDPLGDAGSFSISASRLLAAGGRSATFVGATVSNLAGWGPNADRPETYSAYVSHLVGVPIGAVEVPLQVTVGVASDVTRASDGSGALSDGVFAGVGVGINEQLSASVSATRTQVNIGTTLSLRGTGASATLGVLDVADNTDRRQVSLSVGYSF